MKARDNPFRVDRVLQLRYRLQNTNWISLLRRLEAMRYRAAIVGDHGSGKSTLLDDLQQPLAAKGFQIFRMRVNAEHRGFEPRLIKHLFTGLSKDYVVLLDGAEQLSRFAWTRFERYSRHCAGLIITTHQSGRLPTLIQCSTNAELLRGIVEELIGDATVNLDNSLDRLYAKYRGNLRDALRELYDLCARDEFVVGRSCTPSR